MPRQSRPASAPDGIVVTGAHEHNLRGVLVVRQAVPRAAVAAGTGGSRLERRLFSFSPPHAACPTWKELVSRIGSIRISSRRRVQNDQGRRAPHHDAHGRAARHHPEWLGSDPDPVRQAPARVTHAMDRHHRETARGGRLQGHPAGDGADPPPEAQRKHPAVRAVAALPGVRRGRPPAPRSMCATSRRPASTRRMARRGARRG
jgi:hypothetical protein